MSGKIPTTRNSLMVRIRDSEDRQSWNEFEAIYRPAVFRFARSRGLQASDAEDLAQQVMLAVTTKIPNWQADGKCGSFRAWLLTVTKNSLTNHVTRRIADQSKGGTEFLSATNKLNDAKSLEEEIDWEFRRAAFRQAANVVQKEFQPETWDCFWITAVEQTSAQDAAKQLGLSIGAVYTNKSRVMKRLREYIGSLEFDNLTEIKSNMQKNNSSGESQ